MVHFYKIGLAIYRHCTMTFSFCKGIFCEAFPSISRKKQGLASEFGQIKQM